MKDILGSPIKVGDTVLTKDYYSPTTTFLTTVIKVNKKSVRVKAKENTYRYSYKYSQKIFLGSLLRRPSEIIVVNEQLAYNKKHFPENFV